MIFVCKTWTVIYNVSHLQGNILLLIIIYYYFGTQVIKFGDFLQQLIFHYSNKFNPIRIRIDSSKRITSLSQVIIFNYVNSRSLNVPNIFQMRHAQILFMLTVYTHFLLQKEAWKSDKITHMDGLGVEWEMKADEKGLEHSKCCLLLFCFCFNP